MKVKDSKDILSSILKTTQMGQVGIRSVMRLPLRSTLRTALKEQLSEYDTIEQEAQSIASSRGWVLDELDPVAKSMAKMVTRTRLSFGNIDSKVAAMMIQGNTRGIIKGYKNIHQLFSSDERVSVLSQKLLDCESANVKQMQGFL